MDKQIRISGDVKSENMTTTEKAKKFTKHSKKERREKAEELIEIIVTNKYTEDMKDYFDRMYEEYELDNDPFTWLPCLREEATEDRLEYSRQMMDELYGHHDGL